MLRHHSVLGAAHGQRTGAPARQILAANTDDDVIISSIRDVADVELSHVVFKIWEQHAPR